MNCDGCGKSIAVTVKDPVVWTSLGRMHHACSRTAWRSQRDAIDTQRAETRAKRSAAMKERHSRSC